MADELSRKRRTRGGHRSTGAIGILAGDVSQIPQHVVKLNQQRATLLENEQLFDNLTQKFLRLYLKKKLKPKLKELTWWRKTFN